MVLTCRALSGEDLLDERAEVGGSELQHEPHVVEGFEVGGGWFEDGVAASHILVVALPQDRHLAQLSSHRKQSVKEDLDVARDGGLRVGFTVRLASVVELNTPSTTLIATSMPIFLSVAR